MGTMTIRIAGRSECGTHDQATERAGTEGGGTAGGPQNRDPRLSVFVWSQVLWDQEHTQEALLNFLPARLRVHS